MTGPQGTLIILLRLGEEFADHALFFFVFDAGKHFLAEPGDRLGLVERHVIVDFATRKMTGLTAGLKNWFYLSVKGRFFWSNQRCGIQFSECRCVQPGNTNHSDTEAQSQYQHQNQ